MQMQSVVPGAFDVSVQCENRAVSSGPMTGPMTHLGGAHVLRALSVRSGQVWGARAREPNDCGGGVGCSSVVKVNHSIGHDKVTEARCGQVVLINLFAKCQPTSAAIQWRLIN